MRSLAIAVAALVATAACAESPTVEQVPIGTDVQLTRQDGGVVQGTIADKDEKTVTVKVPATTSTRTPTTVTKVIPKEEIADVKIVEPDKPVALPPIAKFREYEVPADTKLTLRMTTPVSSETSKVEDAVEATLDEAVTIDGVEVLPAGSIVRGTVSAVEPAGKLKGTASLALHFTTLFVRGDPYPISARWAAQAESTKKEDAKKIGIGAGAGAVIGGILGGKKGAATGAVLGGGAGTAVVLATEGKPIELGREAKLSVSLARAIDVRVPVR